MLPPRDLPGSGHPFSPNQTCFGSLPGRSPQQHGQPGIVALRSSWKRPSVLGLPNVLLAASRKIAAAAWATGCCRPAIFLEAAKRCRLTKPAPGRFQEDRRRGTDNRALLPCALPGSGQAFSAYRTSSWPLPGRAPPRRGQPDVVALRSSWKRPSVLGLPNLLLAASRKSAAVARTTGHCRPALFLEAAKGSRLTERPPGRFQEERRRGTGNRMLSPCALPGSGQVFSTYRTSSWPLPGRSPPRHGEPDDVALRSSWKRPPVLT